MPAMLGNRRLKVAVPGPVDVVVSPAASDECSRSQPGMPNAASVSGRGKGPNEVRLQPSATKARVDGMLVREACAVVLIVGRAFPMGERTRAGVPQPVPKVAAVP